MADPREKSAIAIQRAWRASNPHAMRAYKTMLNRGKLWSHIESGIPSGKDYVETFKKLSSFNFNLLKENILAFGGNITEEESHFIRNFKKLPFFLMHHTNNRSFNNILRSKAILSLKELQTREISHERGADDIDIRVLGNFDFVFFSLKIGSAPHQSRFGGRFIKIPLSQTNLLQNGWISFFDQITTGFETIKFNNTILRKADGIKFINEVNQFVQVSAYPLSNIEWVWNPLQMVFYGSVILNAIAWAIILELRKIRFPFYTSHFFNIFNSNNYDEMNNILKTFFLIEAKIPRVCFIPSTCQSSSPNWLARLKEIIFK